ncbi:MAG: Protein Smg [Rhodocyclaceae bacterium]|jgi:Smg protein|nr:Protein Smg [Rhodocyclaceae bacterium]
MNRRHDAAMFDILVYLFENFFHADAYPEPEQLALKLSAAGFEDEEISEALQWLDGLQEAGGDSLPAIAVDNDSLRCYAAEETARLDTDCRGFIAFLESAGVLNPLTRELIIERAMALSEHLVPLSRLKIIVLMVLWQQHQAMDSLILEELLSGNDARYLH